MIQIYIHKLKKSLKKFKKFANEPFVKFLSHTFMCTVFIGLITYISTNEIEFKKEQFKELIANDSYSNICNFLTEQNQTSFKNFFIRPETLLFYDIMILIFIIG